VRVAADCERQNYHPIYLIQGSGFAGSYLTSPGIKDNMWAEMPDVPFTSTIAAVQAMNASVDKYYPGLRQSPSNWTEANLIAWASGMLLEDAVKAGGLGPSTTPSRGRYRARFAQGRHLGWHVAASDLHRQPAPQDRLLVHGSRDEWRGQRGEQWPNHLRELQFVLIVGCVEKLAPRLDRVGA
jgi:hypothetical protein